MSEFKFGNLFPGPPQLLAEPYRKRVWASTRSSYASSSSSSSSAARATFDKYKRYKPRRPPASAQNKQWPPLTNEQDRVVLAVGEGKSVFFTGQGGSGKTFLIDYLHHKVLDWATTYVTATTGVAAFPIGGTTLHSFAGIKLGQGPVKELIANLSAAAKKRWLSVTSLIIDEISMLDAALFDKLDQIARAVRKRPNELFGGIQMILSGDFLQLPSVERVFPTDFCFKAQCWKPLIGKNEFRLRQSLRQTDPVFRSVLEKLRVGICDEKVMEVLQPCLNRAYPKDAKGIRPMKLYPHRTDVSAENEGELARCQAKPEYVYKARDHGDLQALNFLKKNCQALDALTLRIGAQVMLIKNRDFGTGLVNGTQGVVRGFAYDTRPEATIRSQPFPVVEFANGTTLTVVPEEFEFLQDGEVVATREQLPLILAWAVTIHKCQGATVSTAVVNVKKCFEYGQVYVALSRVRSLEGLYITDFDPASVRAHPEALEFYRTLEEESQ